MAGERTITILREKAQEYACLLTALREYRQLLIMEERAEDYDKFLDILNKHGVTVLVFSGGDDD